MFQSFRFWNQAGTNPIVWPWMLHTYTLTMGKKTHSKWFLIPTVKMSHIAFTFSGLALLKANPGHQGKSSHTPEVSERQHKENSTGKQEVEEIPPPQNTWEHCTKIFSVVNILPQCFGFVPRIGTCVPWQELCSQNLPLTPPLMSFFGT